MSQWKWELPQPMYDTGHTSCADCVVPQGKASCTDKPQSHNIGCNARVNSSHLVLWHAHTCKATLTGSFKRGNGVRIFNGRVRARAKARTVDTQTSSSVGEGSFKLPEKARRLSGYPGASHVLLPLYLLKEKLDLHVPAPKGVCLSTKVDCQEYSIMDGNNMKQVRHKIQLSDETAPKNKAIKGVNCFFGNVTSFSTNGKHFIRLNRHKWHVVGLLETHDPSGSEAFWNQLSY